MSKTNHNGLLVAVVGIGLISVISMLFMGCNGKGKGDGTITLTYGELNPDKHPITRGAYEFARLVKEKTDDRIQINIYPAGQLGSEREQTQSVQAGGIDFFRSNALSLPEFGAEKMGLLALPYIFADRDHMWRVLNGPIGKQILQDVSDYKMVGITYFDDGQRHIFADKQIDTIDDLKGLKLRVPQFNIMIDMVNALGASPTPISYGELYTALQSGIVDGAENTITGYKTNSFFEPCPYLTLTRHLSAPGVLVCSEKTWSKLSAADQEIIKQAAAEASDFVREQTKAYEAQALKTLQEEHDVTVTEIEDVSPWIEAVAPLHEKYGEGHQDIIDAIKTEK